MSPRNEPLPPFPAEPVPRVSPARVPTDPTKPPGVSFRVRTGVGRPRAEAEAAGAGGPAVKGRTGPDGGKDRPKAVVRDPGATAEVVEPAPADDRPERVAVPAASTPKPPLPPASPTQRVLAVLRHGHHRRGRGRVVPLLGLAAALALAVASLVRVVPDSGPGTAEAEPRRPARLTVEPSAGLSAAVGPVASASKAAAAAAPRSPGPAPGDPGSRPGGPGGPRAEASPAHPTRPGETPSAPGQQSPATREAPTPAAPALPSAPAPAPTVSASPSPPDEEGLCVPVLGLCLELRGR